MAVPLLAEAVDAVVGVNTHHGIHEVRICSPAGTPIATASISSDNAGYADLLSWIVTHAPGPRLAVSGEQASSYAAGVARAVAAVGLMVIERDEPHPDPFEVSSGEPGAAHLETDRLPTSTGSDRAALRILLSARQDMTITLTAQSNRLRALLLGGDDTDRRIARGTLTEITLAGLTRRRQPGDAPREHSVRHAEIRRLALAVSAAGRELKANTTQLQAIVDDLVPGLTDRRGIGPVGAAQAIVSLSDPSRVPTQRGTRRIQFSASQQRPNPPVSTG